MGDTLESTISGVEDVKAFTAGIMAVAEELAAIFGLTKYEALRKLPYGGDYCRYLEEARALCGQRRRIERLESEGTTLYISAAPSAHTAYESWAKPKQVRTERQMRLAMSQGSGYHFNQTGIAWLVEEIRTGQVRLPSNFGLPPDEPMHYSGLLAAAHGLQALVEEDRNEDETYPYWERIRGAVIIEPRPGYAVPLILHKEDGFGNFESDYRFDECCGAGTTAGIESVIGSLVREKVIFFPLKTKEEVVNYRNACYENIELPLEFPVMELDNNLRKTGTVKGKVVAQEFNPFAESQAEGVVKFFEHHIL